MKNEENKRKNNIIFLDCKKHKNTRVFTPGEFLKHKIQDGYFNTIPIFAIGNDRKSILWVKTNKNYLKKIDAIGVVVNIENLNMVETLKKEVGIHLTPTNLNGLEKIVGTTHYPFLIKNGWIFQ